MSALEMVLVSLSLLWPITILTAPVWVRWFKFNGR